MRVIKEEEESFLRTLETGIRLLERKIEASEHAVLSGEDAFTLYDTYGFPLDLTALILTEHGMTVDEAGFEQCMQTQRERARGAAQIDADDWQIVRDGEALFVGYDYQECEAQILRYRKVKQKGREFYQVVLSQSPFYAEMGGQVGDSGYLSDGVSRYEVFDTKRENNLAIHLMNELPSDTTTTLLATIDTDRRRSTEANHTATHLLHEALREVLGKHVEQKGSFVSPEVLRFDFSHFAKVEFEQLRQVERLVNERIRANYARQEYRDVPIAQAQAMGAMALFGEKYGEEVRVLQYGNSIELCGGTHVARTGDIGFFRILSESSIAAGVRRIEATTGKAAEQVLYSIEDSLLEIKEIFHNNPQLITAIRKTIDEHADLQKQVQEFMRERIAQFKATLLSQSEEEGGVRLFVVRDVLPEVAKDLAFQLLGELQESFLFVASSFLPDGKCNLTLMLSKDLVESRGWNASTLIRSAAKHIQGGGGGQSHFATAGGKMATGMNSAIEQILNETVRS